MEEQNKTEQIKLKRRKISLKYKIWIISLTLLFTAFFCVLMFQVRVFEPFGEAKVIYYESGSGKYNSVTYLVEGVEYTKLISPSFGSTHFHKGPLYFIEYQISDPTYTFVNRLGLLIPMSIVCGLMLVGMVLLTVYEIKKGLKT